MIHQFPSQDGFLKKNSQSHLSITPQGLPEGLDRLLDYNLISELPRLATWRRCPSGNQWMACFFIATILMIPGLVNR